MKAISIAAFTLAMLLVDVPARIRQILIAQILWVQSGMRMDVLSWHSMVCTNRTVEFHGSWRSKVFENTPGNFTKYCGEYMIQLGCQ